MNLESLSDEQLVAMREKHSPDRVHRSQTLWFFGAFAMIVLMTVVAMLLFARAQ